MDYPEDPLGNSATFNNVFYKFSDETNACWRDDTYTPGALIGHALGIPHVNIACAGAFYDQVIHQWNYVTAKYSNSVQNSTVLLTFGANDAVELGDGFWELRNLFKCVHGWIPWIANVNVDSMLDWLALEDRLQATIGLVAQTAPATSVVRVVAYPIQFRPGILCFSIAMPCSKVANVILSRVNSILERATNKFQHNTQADLQFVDPNYLDGTACSLFNKNIRDVAFESMGVFSFSSFHPTRSRLAESTMIYESKSECAVSIKEQSIA